MLGRGVFTPAVNGRKYGLHLKDVCLAHRREDDGRCGWRVGQWGREGGGVKPEAAGKSWLRWASKTEADCSDLKKRNQHLGLLLDHVFKVHTSKIHVLIFQPGPLKAVTTGEVPNEHRLEL